MPSVAVVIPAYQAEKTIFAVISKIPDWIENIIIVDDCSSDHTNDIVNSIGNERIIYLRHEVNRGVGGAMKTGYKKALEIGADIVVKMDSDDQMNPNYLVSLISPLVNKDADYTKGNRFLRIAELKQMPRIRRIGNASLSFFTKFASGYWNIFDPTNGYTAISKKVLAIIDFDNLSERYFFESSMLLELCLHRIVVKDVNIPALYNDEKSSLSETKSIFEFPPKLFKGLIRRIVFLYFLLDFSAVSLLLSFGIVSCLFGSIWGIVYWIKSATTNMAASTGTVMIAVLPLILGIQFLLQALVLDIQNIPKDVVEE
ncbi:MAG: glycosyltransferase family 2 protein [Flexilinea sp.]